MKATAERVDKNRVELTIEVEAERLGKALDQAYRKVSRNASVPGFRKGKAPRVIFERYYGKAPIYEEAMEKLAGEVYLEAVKDTGIEPVSQPDLEVEQLEEGKPLIMKARVDVKPEVVLGEYKGLEVEKPVPRVTDEDVEQEIEKLRNRYAKLVTLEEGEAREGDIVTIDYEGTVDGEPFEGSSATDRQVEIGQGFVAEELDKGLVGMAIGETKEFPLPLPEDYGDKRVAGREGIIKVTVKGIRRKELAEVDDEFAKDVSEFDTLDELKADLRKNLEEAAAKKAEADVKAAAVEQAVANAEVDIPDSMINNRVEDMYNNLMRSIAEQGMQPEHYFTLSNTNEETVRAELRGEAERQIKHDLVLEAIGKQENVEATEEEIKAEVARMAEFYRQDADQMYEMLKEGGQLDTVKRGVVRSKVIDFLVSEARVKEIEKGEEEAGSKE